MTSHSPRIAVIGTNIGSTLHIRALQLAGFAVTTLAGRDATRTAERAAHFGIPHASTSVEDTLASDIDAVVVATPPATHHPIAMAAIAAGKHVLCEKPLAATAELAAEMRDAADAAGIVHVLQHQLRWRPANAMLRQTVAEGTLGELIQGVFIFDVPMLNRPKLEVPDWWRAAETGGGWLRNWNSHGIDLIRYTLGEFRAVSARLHTDPARGMSADDSYVINFVLENGMQGVMSGSCRAWSPNVQQRVMGANATAIVQAGATPTEEALLLADKDGTRKIDLTPELRDELHILPIDTSQIGALPNMGEDAYQAIHARQKIQIEQISLCTAFRRRIEDRNYTNPALANFDDGVKALHVIEAVEQANQSQRWVETGA